MLAPGTLNLGLEAFLKNYPDRTLTIPFSVGLSSSELQCLNAAAQKYKFGDPPLNFGITYQNTTINTGIPLTAVKEAVALDARGGEIEMPGFVKYNAKTGMFTVKDVTIADFRGYNIGLKVSYAEFPSFKLTCSIPLTLSYSTGFSETGSGEKLKAHKIKCGEPWSTIIPDYVDAFGMKAETAVDLGPLSKSLLYISA